MTDRLIPFSRCRAPRPSPRQRFSSATVAFLLVQYPALPDCLPVHFKRDGVPDGWQYKTVGRVLLPAFIQASLALTFGAIAVLLMSRPSGGHEPDAPEVRAASAAAETVPLIAAIWIGFQGYAAFALIRVWATGHGNLGRLFSALELIGLILTGLAAVRGHARVGRPAPRPYVAEHWRFGQLYKNAERSGAVRTHTRWLQVDVELRPAGCCRAPRRCSRCRASSDQRLSSCSPCATTSNSSTSSASFGVSSARWNISRPLRCSYRKQRGPQ